MSEQLTFADLPEAKPEPKPDGKYAWLHAPLTRAEQEGKELVERLKAQMRAEGHKGERLFGG